ncbi:MAG: hypothetical protein RJA57_1712 [Bacteroidota bacterium]|jgi:F0F1-type ATP synthase assembly protein I
MTGKTNTGLRKDEVAYGLAIVLGLLIGILIRRIRVGLMIGVVLCLLIGLSTLTRFIRKR